MHSIAEMVLPYKFLQKLMFIIERNNKWRTEKYTGKNTSKVCSVKTQKERRSVLLLCYCQLWKMGYHFVTPTSLGGRHVYFLATRWDQEGVSLATLHSRLSILRTFSCWIGKAGMVRPLGNYLPHRDVHRVTVAQKNLAWTANDVEPAEVIKNVRELDERLAVMLALQDAFGLRMKESIEMRPEYSLDKERNTLEIYRGTKGGRPRSIPIDTEYKKEVFEWARKVASTGKSGRVRWPDLTWSQARRRYYYLLSEKLGINKKEKGVSSHGLRHGFAQQEYSDITGMPTPVQGADPAQVDIARHNAANITVAKVLGHGRTSVTASYYGSHGHLLRRNKTSGASAA